MFVRAGQEAWGGLIRGAKPSDLRVVEQLVARTMAHPWSRSQLAESLEGSAARTRLAWPVEGERGGHDSAAGFVVARRISDLLEIDLVGVDPAFRRRGLGAALVSELIESEQLAGAAEVQLELAASNEPAQALYESLDFVVVGRRPRYYPDGEDALLLTRSLI